MILACSIIPCNGVIVYDSKRGGVINGPGNEIEIGLSLLSELCYIISSLTIDVFLLKLGGYKMRASDLNTSDI